jgi:NAD+ diphosphatase
LKGFLFQDDALLVPVEMPDDFYTGIIYEKVDASFESTQIEGIEIPSPMGTVKIIDVASNVPLPAQWQAVPVRQVISAIPENAAGTLFRAFHIAQWRRESVFCGKCGTRNIDAETEFARACPQCGRLEFPRISPAVIVRITNDKGNILLAHNKKFKHRIYSLIAGFNEAGETLEETVVREIKEEVNIEVKNIRYVTSQSWPFPNSLMLGFTARYAGGTVKPDGVEIEDARWFDRDNMPSIPDKGSVSRQLIDHWFTEGQMEGIN